MNLLRRLFGDRGRTPTAPARREWFQDPRTGDYIAPDGTHYTELDVAAERRAPFLDFGRIRRAPLEDAAR